MPLVLSLKRGQDFYVGSERLIVDDIRSDTHFRVRRERDGRVFDVVDTEASEVLPDVFVLASERSQARLARLAIEAPRDVLVLRGDHYRREPPEPARR